MTIISGGMTFENEFFCRGNACRVAVYVPYPALIVSLIFTLFRRARISLFGFGESQNELLEECI